MGIIGRGERFVTAKYLLPIKEKFHCNESESKVIFAGTEIPIENQISEDDRIGHQSLEVLLRNLSSHCDLVELGLDVGKTVSQKHGNLGYTAVNSRTLGDALSIIESYQSLRFTTHRFKINNRGDQLEFFATDLTNCYHLNLYLQHVMMGLLLAKLVLIESTGVVINFNLELNHNLQAPLQPWQEKFPQANLTFNGDKICWSLPASLANANLFAADNRLHRLLKDVCEKELSQAIQPKSVTERCKDLIINTENKRLNLEEAAEQLCMSSRNLSRKLKEEGIQFSKLRDEILFAQACHNLIYTNLTIEEISHKSGFTELSNFSRSFRKHFGRSPAQFRAAAPRAS